ncbi:MAG: hypothetical protein ABI808_13890 [Pseudonocardiales bacterium]
MITSESKDSAERTFDPLRYCIFTTVALIAWAVGPPIAVAVMSALGIAAYWSAWRAGLRTSKCVLRDVRLVLLYLGVAFVAGVTVAARNLLS